jgi:hypothetical protein
MGTISSRNCGWAKALEEITLIAKPRIKARTAMWDIPLLVLIPALISSSSPMHFEK